MTRGLVYLIAGEALAVVLNLTPVPRQDYRVPSPEAGRWVEIFNSDAEPFGGSGQIHGGAVAVEPVPFHGRQHSVRIVLPPLGAAVFQIQS